MLPFSSSIALTLTLTPTLTPTLTLYCYPYSSFIVTPPPLFCSTFFCHLFSFGNVATLCPSPLCRTPFPFVLALSFLPFPFVTLASLSLIPLLSPLSFPPFSPGDLLCKRKSGTLYVSLCDLYESSCNAKSNLRLQP